MKHARALAQAAAISFLFATPPASAAPLNGSWLGVASSADPTTGPLTNSVTADAAAATMTVRFACGASTPCSVTGAQYAIGPQQFILVPPAGATTPAPFFVLATNGDCAARYGSSARIGVWLTNATSVVVKQCFTVTPPLRIIVRPNQPPIRLQPLVIPQNIQDLARNARPVPNVQLPPGAQVPPRP